MAREVKTATLNWDPAKRQRKGALRGLPGDPASRFVPYECFGASVRSVSDRRGILLHRFTTEYICESVSQLLDLEFWEGQLYLFGCPTQARDHSAHGR
jgi:hypothetical protein